MMQDPELLALMARARTVAAARDGARKLLAEIRWKIEARRSVLRDEARQRRIAEREAGVPSPLQRRPQAIAIPATRSAPALGPKVVRMARVVRAETGARFYGDTQPRASR